MIKGLFQTFDGDVEASIFCLDMLYNKGLTKGINFFIPYQEQAVIGAYRRAFQGRLQMSFVHAPPGFGESFLALADALGETNTVFFATSDRYPIAPVDPDEFECIKAFAASSDYDSVRLTRWKETLSEARWSVPGVASTEMADVVSERRFGAWHPQFFSGKLFERLVACSGNAKTLREWHDCALRAVECETLKVAAPAEQLTVFEEPTIAGKSTLNYALRQWARGNRISPERVRSVSATFTNPQTPRLNKFWENQGEDSRQIITRLMKPAPINLFTVGGVGSKMLLNWAYGHSDLRQLNQSHSHWRFPPIALRDNSFCVYVFGDPVATVASFFSRREQLHDRHGFAGATVGVRQGQEDFVLRAMANNEVSSEELTEFDGLDRYVELGEDRFRLEEHLNNFLYSDRPYPVLFVRYETLWDRIDLLGRLFGRPVDDFPKRIPRAVDNSPTLSRHSEALGALYAEHRRRIAALPDLFIVENGARRLFDS
jgi:hypothetical protein